MSEWLLEGAKQFLDFQAEYEGSIPFTRSIATHFLEALFHLRLAGIETRSVGSLRQWTTAPCHFTMNGKGTIPKESGLPVPGRGIRSESRHCCFDT
ncbi:hypothetical protein [Bradyrhizobium sp.]|uniref:hypothetical protein n=2 Tax=Bradyrhizobium sp. TaxID=376 RepID=UPI001ED7A8FB|nr:hypothetical protein [Bradyrhizobium sp.]MBV9983854.1 hypothetical protein [Bradyrhizobium sp.]